MPRNLKSPIADSRYHLRNPYAYLIGTEDGSESFEAGVANKFEPTESVSAHLGQLHNPYAYVDLAGPVEALSGVKKASTTHTNKTELIEATSLNKLPSKNLISFEVKKLHKLLWRNRTAYWPNGEPKDLVEMLDPEIALKLLGFDCETVDTLGLHTNQNGTFEVAGLISRQTKQVQISRQFTTTVQRFTAAHELAHAVMHDNVQMHRDRPLDGSQQNRGSRDQAEIEADKFASLFIMPENLLRDRFKALFLCRKFIVNESTSFALDPSNTLDLLNRSKSKRELARILASAELYNGRQIVSLSKQFRVSIEAMAIRLEELDLL